MLSLESMLGLGVYLILMLCADHAQHFILSTIREKCTLIAEANLIKITERFQKNIVKNDEKYNFIAERNCEACQHNLNN